MKGNACFSSCTRNECVVYRRQSTWRLGQGREQAQRDTRA